MIDVLYEDNHLIVVNKKSGDIVQGDATGDQTLKEEVAQWIKEKYNKPGDAFLGVVHRLDRPVTGVVVFAKTSKALIRMNKLFQDKKIQKTYWALSTQSPNQAQGQLIHYLSKDKSKNKATAHSKAVKHAKKSLLNYQEIHSSYHFPLLELQPLTGRPHQIRVQLASVKAVIVGDLKYGAPKANPDASICLHAKNIQFTHPVSKVKLSIDAPLPALWKQFEI